ncbi:SCO6745 family protein [Streptacidiphilus jiangxiensis]|uniref:SalK n=1 Tax=Streptacidiphilus jiangxiensis TaxID=235985 RepID=A0A1H7VXC7_STRJI|nr:hypothetical protein [Streptacidiphilus jiangxiensis]SEM13448.1 hypothetical protein SAMN05414137_11941 [Streptacidiphilus jiangxiensis]
MTSSSLARALWMRTEPLHAVVYFDPDCRALGRAMGLKGFWHGYFPLRLGPLGAVGPAVAGSVLGAFAPGMVARALPSVWELVTPERAVAERAAAAAAALRRVVPGIEALAAELSAASAALTMMVEDAPTLARPLFAANRPLHAGFGDPVARLWQLTTSLREFRGDAHLAALADHGLDGVESLVLAAATGRVPAASMRLDRGWTEDEWAAAGERLTARGLVDADAARATPAGAALRDAIEDATDRLATRLLRPVGPETTLALLARLEEPARLLQAAGIPPRANPIGLPDARN